MSIMLMLMSISIISIMLIIVIIVIAIKCPMVFVKFVKIKQNYVQVYYVLINIVWIVGDIIFDNN